MRLSLLAVLIVGSSRISGASLEWSSTDIVVDPYVVNEPARFAFHCRNHSEVAVSIHDIVSRCSCIAPALDEEPSKLAPGAEADVTLFWTFVTAGTAARRIDLRVGDGDERVTLRATLRSPVMPRLEPVELEWRLGPDQRASRPIRFVVPMRSGVPLCVPTAITMDASLVEAALVDESPDEDVVGGHPYRLELRPLGVAAPTRMPLEIVFATPLGPHAVRAWLVVRAAIPGD